MHGQKNIKLNETIFELQKIKISVSIEHVD